MSKGDLVSDVKTWVGVLCLEGCQGRDKSRAITDSVLDMSGGQWNPSTNRSGGKERREERERDGAREERTWLWAGQGQDGFALIRAGTSPALSMARQLESPGCGTLTQEREVGVFTS